MNEVMIMRRGGGTKLFAAIGATYPEGFTCTCTGKNSGKVLTAKETPWIFAIPEADEWTVAVNGGSNPSQKVNITRKGQVESVNMSFDLILYERGVFGTNANGSKFTAAVNSQNGVASISDRGSDMLWTEYGNSWDVFYITPKFCPAGFATLNIEFSAESHAEIDSGSGMWGLATSVDTVDDYYPVFAAHEAFNSFNGGKVISCDVSSFTGATEYYAALKFGTTNTEFYGCVTKIWLSR